MKLSNDDKTNRASQNTQFLNLSDGKINPPGVFSYPESVKSEEAQNIKKTCSRLFGYTPKERPEYARKMGMASWKGDTISDRALLAMEDRNQNPMEVIEVFLEKGISGIKDPSPEIEQLWEQVSTDPDWIDWTLLEHGAKVYRRYGVTGFQFQGISSIDSYRLESIGKTLMSTGQYADDTAFKRFLLTCNFWTEISEAGGMKLFAGGWKTALRVRLLHTLIRRSVFNNPSWDADKLGMPINQVGLLGAPLISSVMLGNLLKMLGYRPTDRDIDGLMHLWRYVSHIMGLEEGLFPESQEDGLQMIFDLFNLEKMTDNPEGIELGTSFLECFKPSSQARGFEKISRWIEYKTNIAQTLFFVSPATRKAINSPNPIFLGILYLLVSFPKNITIDFLRKTSPKFSDRYDQYASKRRRIWLKRQISEADLLYRPESKY